MKSEESKREMLRKPLISEILNRRRGRCINAHHTDERMSIP